MLRTKLFQAFAALVLLIGVLFAVIGIRMIQSRVVQEAQNRVRLDLGSIWAVYNARTHEMATVLKLVAAKPIVIDVLGGTNGASRAEAQARLESIRRNFGLDFLTVVDPDGKVIMRCAPPYQVGDYRLQDPAVSRALKGEDATGLEVLSKGELEQEAEGLADRAFLAIEETRHAAPSPRKEETRGMVMLGASPVIKGMQVLGAIYGGVLLNRNEALVDQMSQIVFRDEQYEGRPVGTATIFLHDVRIATTVRQETGNRALGTRVSKEVGERVLDNGQPWIKRAFVVRDWYLSAYDPLRDLDGRVVGMLYLGVLEQPYTAMARHMIGRYALLLVLALLLAIVLAFILANTIARPLHRLGVAVRQMHQGRVPDPVPVCNACEETTSLIVGFNEMSAALGEREARLKEANEKLEGANESLTALNRSYMETLGFVSHELKSPIASVMNYVYLLRELKLGPLTEKQARALQNVDGNVKRVVEMIRHYLNLSRIENGELQPVATRLPVLAEVIQPTLEASEGDLQARHMTAENLVGADVVLHADLNMVREVFENMVSNAIKYGREGGRIRLAAEARDGFVEFAVGNEGEGIPPERLGSMFQKFSRLEHTKAARVQKGTGLGLFITKHIVEAHGGRIEVESRPGEWTQFRFTLPRERSEPAGG